MANCSLFPTAWITAEVIPLVNEGDHQIPNNNAPVSLLAAASKRCKRIVLNQLTEYVTNKNNFTKHQSGYKKLHFTETVS